MGRRVDEIESPARLCILCEQQVRIPLEDLHKGLNAVERYVPADYWKCLAIEVTYHHL